MRKLFSSGFGQSAALECLRSGRSDLRDEMVARSVHLYDKNVREASGIRYLTPAKAAAAAVAHTLEPGFQPDLKSYASLCETQADAHRLADVCCRVRFCVRSTPPPILAKGVSNMPEAYHAEWNRCKDAWIDSSFKVLNQALCDAYMELGKKSPELLSDFLSKLDDNTWKSLYAGVQNRTGPDATPESLAKSKAFMKRRYPGSDKLQKHVELSGIERARSYFYDESFTDGYTYAGSGLRVGSRIESRHKYERNTMDSFILRHDFNERPEIIPNKIAPYLYIFYENRAKEQALEVFRKLGLSDFNSETPGFKPSDRRGVALQSVFHGCRDDAEGLRQDVAMISGMCNDLYSRGGQIMDNTFTDILRHHAFESDLQSVLHQICMDRMDSYVSSTISSIYDEVAASDDTALNIFVSNLSDDAYAGLCGRRPVVSELFPRNSNDLNQQDTHDTQDIIHVEVMDEEGLAENQVLNNARTQQLLSAKAYRELLGQCLYRYEYDAYGRSNELNQFLFSSLSGKAPNETFLHVAENCNNPDDARVLARVVNIVCESRDSLNLSDSFDSLLCDDLQRVLCEPDVFKSQELLDAFSSGLSENIISGFNLREFTGVESLGTNPVVCSEDDILFAKQQGFTSGKWFSKKTLRDTVTSAVESSKGDMQQWLEGDDDVFCDVGCLAAACCSEYIKSLNQDDMNTPRSGLFAVMSSSLNSDDARGAAKVCNLCLDAISAGPEFGIFEDLDPDERTFVQVEMEKDIIAGYQNLQDMQKAKFLSGLNPSVREGIQVGLPGCWSNGVLLENTPVELAPAGRYANRLNAFNCPDFSKPVERVRQPVFIQYQSDLDRANEIRDFIRKASKPDKLWSGDAQYALSISCLATYQAYGKHAEAEARGEIYEPAVKEQTYSLYELAEQCNKSDVFGAVENVRVLSKAYRGVMDAIPDDDSVYARGMQYAVKIDMARSLKLLESADMKSDFMRFCDDPRYNKLLFDAMDDMPVYINSDAQKFAGRARPKGIRDVRESMHTEECIRVGLKNAGDYDGLFKLDAIMQDYKAQSKAKPQDEAHAGRDMGDIDSALSGLSSGESLSKQGDYGE